MYLKGCLQSYNVGPFHCITDTPNPYIKFKLKDLAIQILLCFLFLQNLNWNQQYTCRLLHLLTKHFIMPYDLHSRVRLLESRSTLTQDLTVVLFFLV